MPPEQDKGKDHRDGAGLKQGKHEQHRAAGLDRQVLAEDHHGAAEAHNFPGDQKARGILQAEYAERADEARGSAKEPAPLARCRTPEPRGEDRAGEPKAQ